MGKRVSNKRGTRVGRRSWKTHKRHLAKRYAMGRPATVPIAPVAAPAAIPGPTRRSMLDRIVAPVRRLFNRGNR